MKTKLFILLITLATISCTTSHEEKAQKLVEANIKETLFHPDSYKPIQTTVDSAFTSLRTDPKAINLTMELFELFASLKEYNDNIQDAERDMSIYSHPYTSYGKGEYDRAKETRDHNQRLLEKGVSLTEAKFNEIKVYQSQLHEGEFKGWSIIHKYTSLNGKGSVTLTGETVIGCDPNFTNIEYMYSMNEYEQISEIMQIVESSTDLQEFYDKLETYSMSHNKTRLY